MIKIGFCIRNLYLGGIEKLLSELILSLYQENKYEISLLTKEKTDTYLFNLVKDKVKIFYLVENNSKKTFLSKFISSIKKRKRLYEFSKNLDIVIDFSNGDFYNYVRRIQNKKKIVFIHSSYEFLKNTTPVEKILSKYDIIVTAGIGVFKEMAKNNIKNLYNLENMVDYSNIEKKLKEKLDINFEIKENYFLTVCRLYEKHKDVKTLIEAFSLYTGDEKLIIVGEGPDRKNLEKLTKEKKLENRVIFLGAITNPFVLMKNAKIFILSSKVEGFGLVLVEALYCGTKVISSDCPVGPKEILENGEIGELFETGNPRDLLEKLNTSISKKYDNDKIRNSLDKYSKENYIIGFNNLINKVLFN
ncbi:MAG: glycosyltransferase [Fusobacterium sp.]|uniref:glycosyltransferase n=1 Tax=Fusobacterium sp. TaxID=68766 RepID=UPI0026DAE2FE|nr:glycosyltransferase [Fusobacterium sp.]MDO4690977.1 glycosyltransferase [Fusobacterium sp.]